MKGSVLTVMAAFAIMAVLMGGTIAQAAPADRFGVATAKTGTQKARGFDLTADQKQSLMERIPSSIDDATDKMGQRAKNTILWNNEGTHFAIVSYNNGHFRGEVHEISNPSEVKYMWGIYGNGKWAGFYDGNSIENVFYGKYMKHPRLKGTPYFAWTAENLFGSFAWGLGINVFK